MPDPVRRRDAQATRAALVAAAHRRFTLQGYARTTTRELAADAGVNVALISRYFGSKDGLLAAVLSESTDPLGPDLPGDPVDLFVASLDPAARTSPDQVSPLLLLLRDDADSEATVTLRRAALARAVTRLQGGRRDASSRLRAELALALLAGVAMLRDTLPGEPLATTRPADLATELRRALAHLQA